MDETKLALFWNEIPIGKKNAITYDELCKTWSVKPRRARHILHELSGYDNGDNYILIRTSKKVGFYKTDDEDEIKNYRRECLKRARETLAPIRKIYRVLKPEDGQLNITNNIKTARLAVGLTQKYVCCYMKAFDPNFDTALLSKMENGICLPTQYQLSKLSLILRCEPSELVNVEFIDVI